MTRLPAVDAARANVGGLGPRATGQHLPDRGQRLRSQGAYRVSVRLPDRGQAAQVATPGLQATTHVNATRANVGIRGRRWRPDQRAAIPLWTAPAGSRPSGYAHRRCLSGGRPAAGSRPGYVATPGAQATTPVNAARANGGTRGRRRGQHLPDRSRGADAHRRRRSCGRPDAGSRPGGYSQRAAGHNARERDTGERRHAEAHGRYIQHDAFGDWHVHQSPVTGGRALFEEQDVFVQPCSLDESDGTLS